MDRQLELADLLGVMSIYLNLKNLTENEQQSEQQIKILRQNDVGAANDKQAAYLLKELGQKFDDQNILLEKILKAVTAPKDPASERR